MVFLIFFGAYLLLFVVFPYKTIQITIRTIGYIIYDKKKIGYTIPKTGGALLIANHISHLDFILVTLATKRKVYFVMYDKIYYNKAIHWILRRLNMIPISPSRIGVKNNLKKFNKKCQEIINAGGIVVIYPEGTVSRNGHLLEFKKGMEHITSGINAPIIPMHVFGASGSPFTFSMQKNEFNKFKLKNLRKKIIINIGKPLSNSTSSFLARQKVLELTAENAFYSHSNRYFNFSNGIFKQKNKNILFINKGLVVNALELKKSTLTYASQLSKKIASYEQVLVVIKNELILIKVILALSYLGKKIILLNPKVSQEEFLTLQQNFSLKTCISDNNLNFKSTLKNISTSDLSSPPSLFNQLKIKLPFFFFRLIKLRKNKTDHTSIQCPNFSKGNLSLDELTLTNISAFSESISNTHNIKNYGHTLNLKDIYSPIGFLTKIGLPIMTNLTVLINTTIKKTYSIKINTIIGEKDQVESLYDKLGQKFWSSTNHIITDFDLSKTIKLFTSGNNISIFKATGIQGVVGLLSINTPDYKGTDIAGKELKQDGSQSQTFGRPVQGVAVKIVDLNDKTKTLDANEEGAVLVKGPLVMQPTQNSPFTWIDVELKGVLTPQGYLQLTE